MTRNASLLAAAAAICFVTPLFAADSASIVPGTLTVGSSTLPSNYAQESNNLGDFPRDTGSFGTDVYPITLTNGDYNGNSFGGTPNTIIGFGNGGGVTLKFASPVYASAGQKAFGLFTSQFIDAYSTPGALFDGNMQAAVLVSSDGVNYRTLGGLAVANPTTYTATSSKLNTPTLGYDFGTTAEAWDAGNGRTAEQLAALPLADDTTPVLNENLFNGTGTNADRLALSTDTNPADYAALFGTSAGGNWFDISGSGLASIQYVRLNGVGNDNAVRLDGVFANAAAVPEPAMLMAVGLVAVVLKRRR